MVRYSFFNAIFLIFSASLTCQYEQCTGRCNRVNNAPEGGYDGGDCYECGCANDRLYLSGICQNDPYVLGSAGIGQSEASSLTTCASDAPPTWPVNDLMVPASLASTVNCYGGIFYVARRRSVLVDYAINIPNVTTLYVTGEGSEAEVNGGGKTRLFMAVGADLYIDGLMLINRNATYGRAIAATCLSIFVTQTLSSGDIAFDYGGAIYVVIDLTLVWEGQTIIIAKHDGRGSGAVSVSMDSNASLSRPKLFFDDSTIGDNSFGGAVCANGYSRLTWSWVTSSVNNTAGLNRRALYFSLDSIVSLDGETSFVNNTAAFDERALRVYGNSIVSRTGDTFTANNAISIGVPIYVTTSSNFTVRGGTYFDDNEAAIDGGAANEDAISSYFIVNVSTVLFHGNTCKGNGGAIAFNGAVVTCFPLNVMFSENTAGVAGGARYTSGTNTAMLDEGTIFASNSGRIGGNISLESRFIECGYWRSTNTSMCILACYNPEACLEGLAEEQGCCSKGYEGPYCSVCSKGYTASLGFVCNKCPGNAAGSIALLVVMAAVFLLAFATFLFYTLSGEIRDDDQGIVARVTRYIPLQSVKIVIMVWQILTRFSTVAYVVFPGVYQRFLNRVDVINFDLSWVVSAGCVIDTDFHDQLLFATLGPLVCVAILGGTFFAAMRRRSASEEARQIVRRKHVFMLLLLTFLIYSSVSSTLFKTFACEDLGDGKKYLRADYRIECASPKHKALEIYVGFMVALYVVGIPVFYGILLYNNREALIKSVGREEDESIKPSTSLWKPYRHDRFYYEVIECVRRVLLTGALVFIYPNTAAQIAVALMIALFFIFVSEALAPYASPWDTWCSRSGHAIVYTSMFLALLLKVDVSGELARSQRVFETVLIAAHSCLVMVVVVEAIAMVVAWRKEVEEDTKPPIRLSLSLCSPGVGRVRTRFRKNDGEISPPL